jgi:ribosomal protein S18 acetylase RimI-like enzyme
VTLGLYADNGAARRLYTRLGFSPGIAYSSGRFVDTEDTVDTEDIKEPSA